MSAIKICNRFALTLTKTAKEIRQQETGIVVMTATGSTTIAQTVTKDGQRINNGTK